MIESLKPSMHPFAFAREQFPALRTLAWLGTAGVAPAATPVLRAVEHALHQWREGAFDAHVWEHDAEAARARFASVLGTAADHVALLATLADAAATVARSLSASGARRRIVVADGEFRSNLFPWLALAEQGFDIEPLRGEGGVARTADYLDAIRDDVVLVAVSEVQSSTGFRADLDEIAKRCRHVGARLFVNLTQSLGALRSRLAGIDPDYAAGHAYKWLLAPRGAAFLYVRPDHIAGMRPLAANWKNVDAPLDVYYGGPFVLAGSARRLDASLAWFSWVGARAALDLVASFDAERVEAHCLALAEQYRSGAVRLELDPAPQELPSQIVSVRVANPAAVALSLQHDGVVAAVRDGWVRAGFHVFNNGEDVDRALAALERAVQGTPTVPTTTPG